MTNSLIEYDAKQLSKLFGKKLFEIFGILITDNVALISGIIFLLIIKTNNIYDFLISVVIGLIWFIGICVVADLIRRAVLKYNFFEEIEKFIKNFSKSEKLIISPLICILIWAAIMGLWFSITKDKNLLTVAIKIVYKLPFLLLWFVAFYIFSAFLTSLIKIIGVTNKPVIIKKVDFSKEKFWYISRLTERSVVLTTFITSIFGVLALVVSYTIFTVSKDYWSAYEGFLVGVFVLLFNIILFYLSMLSLISMHQIFTFYKKSNTHLIPTLIKEILPMLISIIPLFLKQFVEYFSLMLGFILNSIDLLFYFAVLIGFICIGIVFHFIVITFDKYVKSILLIIFILIFIVKLCFLSCLLISIITMFY